MNEIHCYMNEQAILDYIPTGEVNAVHSAEICAAFDLTERERRKLFERLRNKGAVICSCDNGFFKPADLNELRRYIRTETARSESVLRSLNSAKALELQMQDGGGGN